MKLFVEDIKGYMETFDNVKNIIITKVYNKNSLIIKFKNYHTEELTIPLTEIRLAYMINIETMEEYFRYEK